ncbi:MAG: zinc ribbon domain-containing protein [Ruminococcus sp.]|nr:zinc ribbon domain-containing protein [Ruminococcus sp.]
MAKFCGKCGAPISDSEKFCSKCGAPTGDATEAQIPQTVAANPVNQGSAPQAANPAPKQQSVPGGIENTSFNPIPNDASAASATKKNLTPIIVIAAIAVVVIIAAIILITQLTKYEKIDASELFDIEFAGPNGYGSCYAQLDIDPYFAQSEYEVYMEDYSITVCDEDYDDVKYSNYFSDKNSTLTKAYSKASDKGEAKDMRDALLETDNGEFELTCKVSKETGLSNGDKVTIEVDFDEEELKDENIKLTNTSFEVEVKGLVDAEALDPFADGFSISFSGNDGYGSADFNNDSTAYDFIYYYTADGSTTYNLSNGDVVTVEAYAGISNYQLLDEEDESKGCWFTYEGVTYIWESSISDGITKDFTVEGLTELTEIDPFDGVTFEYSGATPFLEIDSVNVSEAYADYDFYLSIDQDYGTRYKVGDTFTVLAYAYSGLADAGYKLAGEVNSDGYVEKEFTVDSTMPSYVDTTNAYDALSAYSDAFSNKVTDIRQDVKGSSYSNGIWFDDTVESITSFEEIASYILVNEATDYSNIGWSEDVNRVATLYKMKVEYEEGSDAVYVVIYTGDVISDSNGINTDGDVNVSCFESKEDAMSILTDMEGYSVSKITSSMSASSTATDDTSTADESSEDASTEEVVP